MKMKKLAIANPAISVSPMNVRSASSRRTPRQSSAGPTARRDSRGSVSFSTKAVSARQATAKSASNPKIARQPPTGITRLPISGAVIGATEMTSMTSAISRVASGPVCRSRTIARGITMTAAAPSP